VITTIELRPLDDADNDVDDAEVAEFCLLEEEVVGLVDVTEHANNIDSDKLRNTFLEKFIAAPQLVALKI